MNNGSNNWGVNFSEISFFCHVLDNHSAVLSYERSHDILFVIQRRPPTPPLRVLFVSEYRLGDAAAYRALSEFDDVAVIVNNGNWNDIVLNRWEFKRSTGVDVVKLTQFLGALNEASFGQ